MNYGNKKYQEALSDLDIYISKARQVNTEGTARFRVMIQLESGSIMNAVADLQRSRHESMEEVFGYLVRNRYFQGSSAASLIDNSSQRLQEQPENALLLAVRATAFAATGNHDNAKKDFAQALYLDPKNSIIYFLRGYSGSLLNEKASSSLVYFNEAISIKDEVADYYYHRALCHSANKELTLAFADYDRAIQLRSDIAIFYYDRGLDYFQASIYEKALEDQTKALELNQDLIQARFNRAEIWKALSKPDEAIRDYQQILVGNGISAEQRAEIQRRIANLRASQ